MPPSLFDPEIRQLISDTLESMTGTTVPVENLVTPPETIDAEFAYPCFTLARILRKSPAAIAGEIAGRMHIPDWLAQVSADGPYLNFCIHPEVLFQKVVTEILTRDEQYGCAETRSGQRILVEYSSPNTNKPLHLGHIRNNVLGMAIIRLLQTMGHEVIPASIMNDRGIHICKAMVAYQRFGRGDTPDSTGMKGDHLVGKMYVRFEQALQEQPELMDEARDMLRAWEQGDTETRELWNMLNRWVYDGFKETYDRLGSQFELVQYESDTYLLGKDVVRDGMKKGVLQAKPDGSIWIDLTKEGLDEKAILRKDGTSLYITQDLGVAVERFDTLNLNRAIYVVGSEQIYHFQVLFSLLEKLGFEWAGRCRHLSYGMVYLPEGKMKSREGKVVDADDLMDRMKSMSLDVMKDSHVTVPEDRREETAEAIGLGAIKYYILKFNPQKDIHFDPERSVSFDGATGAYIQYCHARISSVIRKAGRSVEPGVDMQCLDSREEIALIRLLLRYPDVLSGAAEELNPAKLATILWEIARAYNIFYTRHRILDAESEMHVTARLALSAATAVVLRSGLRILGIEPVEEM
ncbi:MAG TPA: arginine--tRNA ligase [bacterium]|nr:arginine--tRNA ligase [bacterium]